MTLKFDGLLSTGKTRQAPSIKVDPPSGLGAGISGAGAWVGPSGNLPPDVVSSGARSHARGVPGFGGLGARGARDSSGGASLGDRVNTPPEAIRHHRQRSTSDTSPGHMKFAQNLFSGAIPGESSGGGTGRGGWGGGDNLSVMKKLPNGISPLRRGGSGNSADGWGLLAPVSTNPAASYVRSSTSACGQRAIPFRASTANDQRQWGGYPGRDMESIASPTPPPAAWGAARSDKYSFPTRLTQEGSPERVYPARGQGAVREFAGSSGVGGGGTLHGGAGLRTGGKAKALPDDEGVMSHSSPRAYHKQARQLIAQMPALGK